MIFTTYWFWIFAAITIPGYWLIPSRPLRWSFLGAACLVFHAHFAGPAGMVPIMVLMVVTYFAGLTRKPVVCVAAIILSVLTLCFYKYSLFLIGAAVQPLSQHFATKLAQGTREIMPGMPPLGISFFVFEFFHYLYEVKSGAEPIRNPLKFLLFSIFFPSLVAGPIKRYPQFIASLEEGSRRISSINIAEGLQRIASGYIKKVWIADNLSFAIAQNQPNFAATGLWGRWMLLAAIAFRILTDFSGYSDIAIGFARLLGVRLPENFDWPYLARNLQDFWQRWHISLSTWIRDYIYIPLGGNRHGVPRRLLNALFAFALCGLWHGAAWNFIVWGLYHGVGLIVCSSYRRIPGVGTALSKVFNKEPATAWVVTQIYVWLGWLVFFYPLATAWSMAKYLFRV